METIFTKYVGNTPRMRILEHLIIGRELDYSLTDITEGANAAWKTTLKIIPILVKEGIVKHTRNIGNAKLFQINKENPIASLLIDVFDKLMKLYKSEEITMEVVVR